MNRTSENIQYLKVLNNIFFFIAFRTELIT